MFYLSLSLPRPDANLTGKSLELNSNYPYPDKGVGGITAPYSRNCNSNNVPKALLEAFPNPRCKK
jgi:hypothetical protein